MVITNLRSLRFPLPVRAHISPLTNHIRLFSQALSVVEGSTSPPLDLRTLSSYFADAIRPRLDRPALICSEEPSHPYGGPLTSNIRSQKHLTWNFGEFDAHIQALARGLIQHGITKGDRVGIILGNHSAYALLQWACASIGAILVTMNPAYRTQELLYALRLAGVSHLFVAPHIRTSEYLKMLESAAPQLPHCQPGGIQVEELPMLRSIFVINDMEELTQFTEVLSSARYAADFRELFVWREDTQEQRILQEVVGSLDKDEVINLQFTSGTTGLPKAVSLTHSNLLNNAICVADAMRLTEADVVCNVPPLFHCSDNPYARLVLGNIASWAHGAAVVYPSEHFKPSAIVDAVVSERCTALHGVPTHFLGLLAEVEKRRKEGRILDFSQLRTGVTGGSTAPEELMRRIIDKLNLKEINSVFGMTETSPISFQTTAEDPFECRIDTVGKPLPHVRAKIIDGEGNIVPIGTPGEVLVSGYLLQKGYWNDERQTADAMKCDSDGTLWMHTGDQGVLDDNGYLRVVGRVKDIIIRGGENIYPAQIENVLSEHPSIDESAAVSVPDSHFGEVVGVWIAPAPGMPRLTRSEVRQAVKERINPQNSPTWVWFVGEDVEPAGLPKTASGKVQKHVLRDWSRDLAQRGVGQVQ